jgi:hypothetical protein
MSSPTTDQLTTVLLVARSLVETGTTNPLTAVAEATVQTKLPVPGHELWRAGCAALEAALPDDAEGLVDYADGASLDALLTLFTKAATTRAE